MRVGEARAEVALRALRAPEEQLPAAPLARVERRLLPGGEPVVPEFPESRVAS